ncbi:MAG TPA: hypothetical protein DEQ38_02445 [Elusimicrobia bacterium]|nr:MAG: hypothetical protein A2089_10755 [Elusimicrobia bacterium GWD2_63_28]HCC46969.1 hypothetical protein [Elusimicrobiota bacterium]
MKSEETGKELEKFLLETAGSSAGDLEANRRVLALFREAGKVPPAVQGRVLARLAAPRRARFTWKTDAPLAAACSAAFLLAFFLNSPRAAAPQLSPDWLSCENFPYYADEARMSLMGEDADWRSDYNFPGWTDGRL